MKKRLISIFIFIAYCAVLIKVMVFKDVPLIRVGQLMLNFGGTESDRPANFIPFKTILPYLFGYKGLLIAGINLVGNIVLLIPIGFLIPFIFPNITWKKTLLVAIASGFIIEIMQAVLHVGIFDIDDVILNALGVMIGYWVFRIISKWIESKNYKNIIISAIILIAAIAAVFYYVYPKGQPINPNAARDFQSHSKEGISSNNDLCGGTGGTGEIVNMKDRTITIRRNDGVNETLNLTDQTSIKTPAGVGSVDDLKIGDRVTVVVYEDQIATAVLVCDVTGL